MVLPIRAVPHAYDVDHQRAWLIELVESSAADGKTLRRTTSGDDIFARRNDNASADSNFLTRLAARSLGAPWVAWH